MPDVILCRKCGAENAPGDQFCGTCGTFLEWSGEPVEREPSAYGPDPGITPPAPPEQPRMAGPLVCTNCGSGNPETRTFCQSCGERLPRPAQGPGSGATSSTGGTSGAAAGQRKPPPRSGGWLPGWLPAVLVVGLVAGVAVVAVAVALRPPDPTSLASEAPRTPAATLTPTLSPLLPSGPPTESVTLTPSGATASSVIGNREMFDAAKAIDGRLDTSWQEGSAEERGEWIEITFGPARLDYLVVYGGYQLSRDAYLANRRPMDVLVIVDDLPPVAFRLADSEQPQRLDFDDRPGATRVRLEIVTTYDPEATAYEGSPFDDMAISEIRLFGQPNG